MAGQDVFKCNANNPIPYTSSVVFISKTGYYAFNTGSYFAQIQTGTGTNQLNAYKITGNFHCHIPTGTQNI